MRSHTTLRRAIRVSEKCWRMLSASILSCAFFFSGCASVPTGTVQTHVVETLWNSPVKITLISLPGPFNTFYSNVQSASGYVWESESGYLKSKTIRIDLKSYEITELSRSISWEPYFLVDENSIWYTNGTTLSKVDVDTNQVTSTIENVGIPFALGGGAVWTYNRRTQVVSGIDSETNQIRTQFATQGQPHDHQEFAFGAGSIWQFSYVGSPSWWQTHDNRGSPLFSVVRRIDPYTNKVIAEIPIGPFLSPIADTYSTLNASRVRIHFLAGAIWVIGRSADSSFWKPAHIAHFVKRIDVENNRVTATIPLEAASFTVKETQRSCGTYTAPQTPVFLDGGIWISMHCGKAQSALLKIDSRSNQIAGDLGFYAPDAFELGGILPSGFIVHHPKLVASGDSLWGIDRDTAIRIEF